MAEISKITLPSGSVYDIKDSGARDEIEALRDIVSGGVAFIGITTSNIIDGSEINPIIVGGNEVEAKNGNLAYHGDKEFIFSSADNKWHEFGDLGSLGALATKDSASGNVTAVGNLSGGAISVTPTTVTKYVAASASAGGSKTDGTAAQCTLPTLTTSVANDTLTIGWTAGSFTPNTPTAVTMPTFAEQTIATGIDEAAITTQPTFVGTSVEVTVS